MPPPTGGGRRGRGGPGRGLPRRRAAARLTRTQSVPGWPGPGTGPGTTPGLQPGSSHWQVHRGTVTAARASQCRVSASTVTAAGGDLGRPEIEASPARRRAAAGAGTRVRRRRPGSAASGAVKSWPGRQLFSAGPGPPRHSDVRVTAAGGRHGHGCSGSAWPQSPSHLSVGPLPTGRARGGH